MIGKNNPGYGKFGSLNVMNNLENRKKVSESKKGRKRVYREDGSHYYERNNYELATQESSPQGSAQDWFQEAQAT